MITLTASATDASGNVGTAATVPLAVADQAPPTLVLRTGNGRLEAVPGASRDRIAGLHGDAIKVQVAAPPEGGRANARLCELLAAALGVPLRAVAVVHGAGNPRKVVAVQGLAPDLVRRRLLDAT